MDKHFKYQRRGLNIIILNVRSNVLFSKCIDDSCNRSMVNTCTTTYLWQRVVSHYPL